MPLKPEMKVDHGSICFHFFEYLKVKSIV